MATKKIGQPRYIDPSLVEIGDDISVEHPENKGIVTTLRGIVAKRFDSGKTRYLLTKEGSTLLAWAPDSTKHVKVILFGREDYPEVTLFELPTEIKDRIA